jgi:hypothetical protein
MFHFECEWRLGFNLNPNAKGTMGYLLFWSGCGGLSLSRDIEVWNPFAGAGQTIASGSTIKCIGLIESFDFSGDDDAPIRIIAYVSQETAANVLAKLAKPITSTAIQVAWYVVSFDDTRKQWFEAAFVKNNAKASASVDTAGGQVQLSVDGAPVRVGELLDIKVHKLEFQIIPEEGASSLLEFATGPTQRLVKNWAA